MGQADDRAEWRVKPWAGTIEQLKRAAQRCETMVANAVPYPPDYDPDDHKRFDGEKHRRWMAAEAAHTVKIQVLEENGFSRRLTSIEDLDDLGIDQLQRIKGIDVDIGGSGYANPSAGLTTSTELGLSVTLAGPDRTWTAGLRHELEEILAPAGKLRPLPLGEEAYLIIVPLLFFALGIGLSEYLEAHSDWSQGVRSAASYGIAALAALVVAAVGWRLPTLELLTPGGKPAYERWRSRILAALGAVILGIAASLIAVQID